MGSWFSSSYAEPKIVLEQMLEQREKCDTLLRHLDKTVSAVRRRLLACNIFFFSFFFFSLYLRFLTVTSWTFIYAVAFYLVVVRLGGWVYLSILERRRSKANNQLALIRGQAESIGDLVEQIRSPHTFKSPAPATVPQPSSAAKPAPGTTPAAALDKKTPRKSVGSATAGGGPSVASPAPETAPGSVNTNVADGLSTPLHVSKAAAATPTSAVSAVRTPGLVERLVGLMTGVGPQSSFALICPNCNSHNGLLPAEAAGIEHRLVCLKCHTPIKWRGMKIWIDKEKRD